MYAILAVKRVRWCWVCGAVSSAILVYLAAKAKLPMQSALQLYYVGMGVYGFWHWSRERRREARGHDARRSSITSARGCCIVLASVLSARWLAAETHAAWPLLDSLVTWTSLMATCSPRA